MKVQRRMYEANRALSYFVTHNWDFKNKNFFKLCSFLRAEDLRDFEFRHDFNYDQVLNIRYQLLGFRRFLMKEKDETIPKSRIRYERLELIKNTLIATFYLIGFYYVFIKNDFMNNFRFENLSKI